MEAKEEEIQNMGTLGLLGSILKFSSLMRFSQNPEATKSWRTALILAAQPLLLRKQAAALWGGPLPGKKKASA